MANPLNTDTTVTLGLLATVGGFIIGAFKWFISINKKIDSNHAELKSDVDLHTQQLNDLEKKVDDSVKVHETIKEDTKQMSERMARIETKIDLILDKKLK